jgi:hypothetical protein
VDPSDQPDRLRLAAVRLDLVHDPVQDRYSVGPAGAEVVVADDPYLVGQRLLQEWVLTARAVPVGPVSDVLVAAALLDPTGAAPAAPFFSRGGLRATPRAGQNDVFELVFDAFDANAVYLVAATPLVDPAAAVHTVELAPPGPNGRPTIRVRRATTSGSSQLLGIQLRITQVRS